jgi:hypothetical protein
VQYSTVQYSISTIQCCQVLMRLIQLKRNFPLLFRNYWSFTEHEVKIYMLDFFFGSIVFRYFAVQTAIIRNSSTFG